MPAYDARTLGQLAYQAYAVATGNETFDGRDMPTWDGLGERIQEAWTAAAAEVASRHEQTLLAAGEPIRRPAATRAKFRCNSIEHFGGDQRTCKFTPVVDDDTPENERYHRYTPGGALQLTVDNPAVSFVPGQFYYLDITPADED